MEWECCIKKEDGAREGAEFIKQYYADKAFDDFASVEVRL
jgi:hypothetical protein